MLPKARSRTLRRRGWPFGRRGNRRVRAITPVAVPRAPRPPLSQTLGAALVRFRRWVLVLGAALTLAGAGVAGHWYVTHSRNFAVRTVRVSPTAHVTAEALVARAAVQPGLNLFAIDRDGIARAVSQEPWVERVHVRRELPSTVMLDVVEREAACTVALGGLYLSDREGSVFKRATADEAAVLPVVTGVARDDYLNQPERARAAIRQALQAIAAWRTGAPERPPIGEAHVDRIAGVTLYTDRGIGVRVGVVDASVSERLRRFDAVAAALLASGEEPRLIFVDNRARPDRVTVKLASAPAPGHSVRRD
jgi:cell division protein FtsQ